MTSIWLRALLIVCIISDSSSKVDVSSQYYNNTNRYTHTDKAPESQKNKERKREHSHVTCVIQEHT